MGLLGFAEPELTFGYCFSELLHRSAPCWRFPGESGATPGAGASHSVRRWFVTFFFFLFDQAATFTNQRNPTGKKLAGSLLRRRQTFLSFSQSVRTRHSCWETFVGLLTFPGRRGVSIREQNTINPRRPTTTRTRPSCDV